MEWRVVAHLSPSQEFQDLERLNIIPIFCIDISLFVHAIRSATLGRINRYIPDDERRLLYIALLEGEGVLHLGTASFTCVPGSGVVELPPIGNPLAGEINIEGAQFPRPHCMLPIGSVDHSLGPWRPLGEFALVMACLSFWASAASTVTQNGSAIGVAFLGYKRASFDLPLADAVPDEFVSGTLRLREWAFQDSSSDRLLALRQIVSLYVGENPFENCDDIRASAEIAYLGLRSEAITEVVKAVREAQSQTMDAVRQALKSSQDLIKSATERFLAGLVAVGAVFIANVSRAIPEDATQKLWLAIAGFFVVLAVVNLFIEGPNLGFQIKHLPGDIRAIASLLTEGQRHEISNSATVGAIKRRILVIRCVVPTIYLTLVAIILVFR
jgi:hypothetical protein